MAPLCHVYKSPESVQVVITMSLLKLVTVTGVALRSVYTLQIYTHAYTHTLF